jgi:hypothetical protein
VPEGFCGSEELAEQSGALSLMMHGRSAVVGNERDEDGLGSQDTRQQIKDGLKEACGVLQVYETTCNDAVNDYADLAFNVALQVRPSSQLL